jgi:hypothetical protein
VGEFGQHRGIWKNIERGYTYGKEKGIKETIQNRNIWRVGFS